MSGDQEDGKDLIVTEVPPWLQCWMSKEEREEPDKRQRWMGRWTFILAAIGSAIGLGNFWRFPFLTYKHGGAKFFFPWLTCLFVMGIPFMIMELALGQKFQRGDIAVFRGINYRLVGIGVISVYSSYVFSWYYNVVVAWALVYFIAGFISPLPWSYNGGNTPRCPAESQISLAEEFYRIDVIRIIDENCVKWTDGMPTTFSGRALGATFATWVIIFLCVWKGVKSSSWIVWITVPVPLLFVIVMIINNATLPGSVNGIDRYFSSGKETLVSEQWSDAAGQIFLGLSVCLGIMTSYGSYNPKDKPIIMDSVIISICNCSFSFVSGFAVWLVVGYLENIGKLDDKKVAGVSLAFITYPTAIDTMSAPNLWALILGSTLFMLGIDSSFSAIEATSTVICDTAWKGKAPRMFIAFLLCVLGFLGSMPFCFNWGFILFDVVDHYLCAFLLLMIGILQAFGCGWFFDAEETMTRSDGHRKAMLLLGYGYWGLLIVCGIVFMCFMDQGAVPGFATFIGLFICVSIGSFFLSGLSFKHWYQEIFMCGVRRIGYACSQMTRPDPLKRMWWETYFVFYWGMLVKFINPMLLWFILVSQTYTDLSKPYEGYAFGWQVLGMSIPILGIVFFVVATFLWGAPDDALDYSEFVLFEEKAKGYTYSHEGRKMTGKTDGDKPAVELGGTN